MTSHGSRWRKGGPVLAALALLGLTLSACTSASDSGTTPSGSGSGSAKTAASLTMAVTGADPGSFDPHNAATSNYQVIFPAYDTLLHVDKAGDLQPWLATEWKFTDPRTLTFTLRDGVKFTDGTAFDADAVKANIEYARDIKAGTGYQGYLKNITGITATDATHVTLALAAPNPGLPFDFSQNPGEMVSPKALANPTSLSAAPVGSGPYVLDQDKTDKGTNIVWKRNPDYWAASQNVFPFDSITMNLYQDPTAAENAAKAGDADLITLFPGQKIDGMTNLNSTSGPNAGFTGAWLDVSGTTQKALADPNVRQALNYAIDTKTIASTVFGGAATPVAAVPVTDKSVAWSDALATAYTYDPAKAKQLLAAAGASNLKIKLISLPVAETFAQALAGDLRKAGIDVSIQSFAGPDIVKAVFSGKYEAGLILQRLTGQTQQDFEGLFTANAFFNIHKVKDPKVDALLLKAANQTDPAAQAQTYQELAVYCSQQAWFMGTLIQQNVTAFKPSAVSVTPPPFGEIFIYHYQLPS